MPGSSLITNLGGGAVSIGNAVFYVDANTDGFTKSLAAAQGQVQKFGSTVSVAMRGVGGDVQQASRSSAMGLLLISQAVEDAQYGFRAIVNNIPGIVMGLGGSAGLAGAFSLSAVAINVWIQNWDSAKTTFGDFVHQITTAIPWIEQLGSTLSGISASALVSASNLSFMPGDWAMIGQITEARGKQKAEAEERTKRATMAREKIEGLRNEQEREKGHAFTELLAEYGPDRLRTELQQQAGIGMRKLKDEQKAKIIEGIDLAIGNALTGRFEPAIEQRFGRAVALKMGEKQEEAERKAWLADIKKIEQDMLRQRQREKEWKIEHRRDALLEEKRRIQEHMRDLKPSQIFQGGLEYAQAVQTSAGDMVRKAQLGKLKDIDAKLQGVRDDLRKQQRAKFQ